MTFRLHVLKLFIAVIAIFLTSQSLTNCQRLNQPRSSISTGVSTPLFPVTKNKKTGFIDTEGKLIIPLEFDSAREFSEGLAAVCLGPCKFEKNKGSDQLILDQTFNGKYGYIDRSGKMIINPRFSQVGDFHKGLALAGTKDYPLLNKANTFQYGYIDKTGTFVIQEQFSEATDFDDSTGLAVACVGNSDTARCGFISTTGHFVINPQYYLAGSFINGVARVLEKRGYTPSYIDQTGRMIWKGEEIIHEEPINEEEPKKERIDLFKEK